MRCESVPFSDCPLSNILAVVQDLKKKEKFREKFSVQDDWVLPFEVVPIINIPGYGDKAAVKVSAHTSVTQFFEMLLYCFAPK